jgi:hypothetical protein
MNLSEEVLMAYADGELDAKTRGEVEDAMAIDPLVAQRVAQHRALRNRLRASFDKVLDEPVPERLLAAARKGAGSSTAESPKQEAANNVIPLRSKRAPPKAVPFWGAIAASFVVGALVWHFGAELYSPTPLMDRNGEIVASGALDRALSNQLVKDQDARSAVQIGVSFHAKDGSYCRTFQLHGGNTIAGMACRQQTKWSVEVLARGETAQSGSAEFRPAASSLPPAIAQAVDQAIDGEPLDANGEARAKAEQWQTR